MFAWRALVQMEGAMLAVDTVNLSGWAVGLIRQAQPPSDAQLQRLHRITALMSQGKVREAEALFREELARRPPPRLEARWQVSSEGTAAVVKRKRRKLRCTLAEL